MLRDSLVDLLRRWRNRCCCGHKPFVILLAGVNGSGKTTSIGKLAHYYQSRARRCCSRQATLSARRRASS